MKQRGGGYRLQMHLRTWENYRSSTSSGACCYGWSWWRFEEDTKKNESMPMVKSTTHILGSSSAASLLLRTESRAFWLSDSPCIYFLQQSLSNYQDISAISMFFSFLIFFHFFHYLILKQIKATFLLKTNLHLEQLILTKMPYSLDKNSLLLITFLPHHIFIAS